MARRRREIERKWLVENPPKLSRRKRVKIIQGYIAACDGEAEVRLRRADDKFFETIKRGTGLKRGEIEIELSRKLFRKLWPATHGRRLEKLRYTLEWRGSTIELDVYRKELSGLKVAEVEFKTRKQAHAFSPPAWFGREVTEEEMYKNANLAGRKDMKGA